MVRRGATTAYQSAVDHLLVDGDDFNAPISYSFQSDKRMWYQRTPSTYVGLTGGWESISLPFTAELVTTQQKGELTHFYDDADQGLTGHEYWLREYRDITGVAADKQATAVFRYPATDRPTTNTAVIHCCRPARPTSSASPASGTMSST